MKVSVHYKATSLRAMPEIAAQHHVPPVQQAAFLH